MFPAAISFESLAISALRLAETLLFQAGVSAMDTPLLAIVPTYILLVNLPSYASFTVASTPSPQPLTTETGTTFAY